MFDAMTKISDLKVRLRKGPTDFRATPRHPWSIP